MNLKNKKIIIPAIVILLLLAFSGLLVLRKTMMPEEWRLYNQIRSKSVFIEWFYLKLYGDEYLKRKVDAFSKFKKLGIKAVEPLIKCLNDRNFFVRKNVRCALLELGELSVEPLIS